MRNLTILLTLVLYLCEAISTLVAGQANLVTVAASYGSFGAPVNGISIGSNPSVPVLNDWGQVAFRADEYFGYYVTAAWLASPSSDIQRLINIEETIPGTVDGRFETFIYVSANGKDKISFYGVVDDRDYNWFTSESAIWTTNLNAEMKHVASLSTLAPGTTEVFDWPFNTYPETQFIFKTSNTGSVAFTAAANPAGSIEYYNRGIWAEDGSGVLQLIARDNTPLHGGHDGTIVRSIYGNSLKISEDGRVSFLASSSKPDYQNFKQSIWHQGHDGSLDPVVTTGDLLPARDSSLYLNNITHFSINNAGVAAFVGVASSTAGPLLLDQKTGIWIAYQGQQPKLVALEGDATPGINAVFRKMSMQGYDEIDNMSSTMLINSQGDTAFMAQFEAPDVTDDNDTALWLRRNDGSYHLIAREGEESPNGSLYGSFLPGDTAMSLNRFGQLVFHQATGNAIWATDRNDNLVLIAEHGQSIDVDNGPGVDLRTIGSIEFLANSGGEDGERSGFNDRGQIAFRANLGAWSAGIFLSNAVAVPEPGTIFLAISLTSFALLGRRRFS